MLRKLIRITVYLVLVLAVAGAVYYYGVYMKKPQAPAQFAVGNGRIEATEVDVSAKLPGRLKTVLADEGDFVKAGQVVAVLDTDELNAKLAQAKAQTQQTIENRSYANALLAQNKSELSLAQKDYERAKNLYINKNVSLVQLQQAETRVDSAKAVVNAASAKVVSSEAAIKAAKAQEQEIMSNIEDSVLTSPIDGRVQYRLKEPGEVIGSGGKVLVILDLTDVYMTIFLPTEYAGRVDVGTDARIVMDALPDYAIPAKVSFVSPDAQFTPKEIETQTEREKLVFRIKVKIDQELLKKYISRVKTGLPGVAHVRLDPNAAWPDELNRLPGAKDKK